jgi:hypothetical protein
MAIFIAIFEQADGNQYVIEYQPRYSPLDRCVLIEIVSVTHSKRAVNWQEQRAAYVSTPLEPHQGMTQPVIKLEQMRLPNC